MAKLVELELGDGRSLLVEADDDVSVPRSVMPYKRTSRDTDVRVRFESVAETLRGFTDQAVRALQDVDADVERVRLQFGVSLGGDAGVPFVTKGSEGGALSVTIDCNLGRRGQRLSLDDD
jgi:hypothetical protein